MERSKVIYQFHYSDDYFLRQLKEMHTSLKDLSARLNAPPRRPQAGQPPQTVVHQHTWRRTTPARAPRLLFPFSTLAFAIDGLLTQADQAVGRWVKEGCIAGWMRWCRTRRGLRTRV